MPVRAAPVGFSPRKTPVQARSTETVRVIVEAAARVLEEDGFAGYTTNAVAHRAGVSVGSLYQYFPGRDALTRALIQRETAILVAEAADLAPGGDGRGGIVRLIRAAVAHQLRRPRLARLLDVEEARLPLQGDVQQVGESICAVLETLLGALNPAQVDDRSVAARDILAMTKGMVDAAGQQGETDAQGLEVRVTQAVFGYLERAGERASAPMDGSAPNERGSA